MEGGSVERLTSDKNELDTGTAARPAGRGESREDIVSHHTKCGLSIEEPWVIPMQNIVDDLKSCRDGTLTRDREVDEWHAGIDRQWQTRGHLKQLTVECIVRRSVCATKCHSVIGNKSNVGHGCRVDHRPGVYMPSLPRSWRCWRHESPYVDYI